MDRYQVTSAVIGFSVALCILWLVRRDRLHGRFALGWILAGVGCAALGLVPHLFDDVALALGVNYPPILALIVGIGFLTVKILLMDIERSRNEVKIHRLAQRLAMLEGELLLNRRSDRDEARERGR